MIYRALIVIALVLTACTTSRAGSYRPNAAPVFGAYCKAYQDRQKVKIHRPRRVRR